MMAIPLWRQYTRLSREDRDEILGRRRGRLDEASTRREVLRAFLQDASEIREAYRERDRDGDGVLSAADTADVVDNSPFARRQRAFADFNERDRALANSIATRTSIEPEDLTPTVLQNYRDQVSRALPNASAQQIDDAIRDNLARNFPPE